MRTLVVVAVLALSAVVSSSAPAKQAPKRCDPKIEVELRRENDALRQENEQLRKRVAADEQRRRDENERLKAEMQKLRTQLK